MNGGSSMSRAARAWLLCGVVAVHGALLSGFVAANRPEAVVTGGAPVINVALIRSPRTDGRNSAEQTAARGAGVAQPTPPDRPTPRVQAPRPEAVPPPPAGMALASLELPASPAAGPAPTGPDQAPGSGSGRGEDRVDSAAGRTSGGGAPTLGAAAALQEDRYAAEVIAWIERHKRNPGGRLSGVAVLRFVLDRQGRVRDVEVIEVEGDRRVGQAALDVVRAAEPFPRPPTSTRWRTREFRVRLDYRPV